MTVCCYLLSLSQSVNSPDNREFELSPLQPDEMCCFAPPARMEAAHAMGGNSEHRQKWECIFLRCVCAWLRSSHGITSNCIFKAPCAAAVRGLCTSFSGSYPFQFHMNNGARLLMKLAEMMLVTCWLNTEEGIGRVGVLADHRSLKTLSPV